MSKENNNLFVDCLNPFIYNQLQRSFQNDNYSTAITANQNEGLRIDFSKEKDHPYADLLIHINCWKDIEDCGVQEYICENLGNIVTESKAIGANIALRITKDDYEKGGDAYLKKVASIQQYVIGAAFHKYFKALESNSMQGLQPKHIQFYSNESVYIIPKYNSVSVIFSINEEEDTDRALMQIFLLEFSEAKRVVAGGPTVNFVRDEPADLKGIYQGVKPSVGFLVFSFGQQHVVNGRIDNVCFMMTSFRFYLDYHIKSSKTYLHGRMRNRADQWKELLRDARFEDTNVMKTTMSGKTFVK